MIALRAYLMMIVFLPLLAALATAAVGAAGFRAARGTALFFALMHLLLTAVTVAPAVTMLRDRSNETTAADVREGAPQFLPLIVPGDPGIVKNYPDSSSGRTRWTLMSLSAAATTPGEPGPAVQFYIGLDGLNVWLLALSSVMMLPAILVSWNGVKEKAGSYYAWVFVLQMGAIGAFLAFDAILFYAFFELTLIPAFFLIGRWGTGSARRDAARKFFLYTLAGSLLTLVGIVGVSIANPLPNGQMTFSIPDLMANVHRHMDAAFAKKLAGDGAELAARMDVQFWLFIALMAGFAVKTPIFPFHTWLPAAYGEAPIGVTMLLSALLAKLGTFGILRLVLPLTPDAAVSYGLPVVGTLAAAGIIYGALCAYAQRDIKMMVAYSSVSHLGFLVLGLFAFNAEGLSGAALHMVNHGLATGAMFGLLAFLLDRYRTTDMRQYGGLLGRFPTYAFLMFVICLANVGLPSLNNFVSEMLMLAGLVDAKNPFVHRQGLAVVAVVGVPMSAWYTLTMLQRVFFNPLREPPVNPGEVPADCDDRERLAFGVPAVLGLLLGLFPQALLKPMKADVATLVRVGEHAKARVTGVPLPPPPKPTPAAAAPTPAPRPAVKR